MMKILYLMRGMSGSGKTSTIESLKEWLLKDVVILSADDFFMTEEGYKFNPSKLEEAHKKTQDKAASLMKKGHSICIDNTNCSFWEMRPYVEMAEKYEYGVVFLDPATKIFNDFIGAKLDSDNAKLLQIAHELSQRTVHKVPQGTIWKSMERYELNPTVEKVLASTRPINT